MRVTTDDVRHIASLARLRFSEAERERLAGELSCILDYADQLGELDTSAVPPMARVLDRLPAIVGRPRWADRTVPSSGFPGTTRPDIDGTYFRVSRVIE